MVVKGEGGGWAGRHEGEEQVGGNSNFPFHNLTPTHPHTHTPTHRSLHG